MFSNIDPAKSAITSVLSAAIGTVSNYCSVPTIIGFITVDVALQRLAWTIAVLAGGVAIVNGTRTWFKKVKKVKSDESDTNPVN